MRARAVAIAIIDVGAEEQIVGIAVTTVVIAGQAEGDGFADRAGNVGLGDDGVVIAVADFSRTAERVGRRRGDDRDDTGAGVLAEQRRLRAAEHFDAAQVGQIADLGRRPRAIDAIDEHANRRFDTGVIGAVAEAADDEIGVGRALQLRHAQAGDQGLNVEQIADLRLLDCFCSSYRYGDRCCLQRLFTLGCSDDDVTAFAFGLIGGNGICRSGIGGLGEQGGRRGGEHGRPQKQGLGDTHGETPVRGMAIFLPARLLPWRT